MLSNHKRIIKYERCYVNLERYTLNTLHSLGLSCANGRFATRSHHPLDLPGLERCGTVLRLPSRLARLRYALLRLQECPDDFFSLQ